MSSAPPSPILVTVSLKNDTFLRYDRRQTRLSDAQTRGGCLVEGKFAPLFLGRFEHWNELGEVQADDEFVQQNVCGPVIIASTKRML